MVNLKNSSPPKALKDPTILKLTKHIVEVTSEWRWDKMRLPQRVTFHTINFSVFLSIWGLVARGRDLKLADDLIDLVFVSLFFRHPGIVASIFWFFYNVAKNIHPKVKFNWDLPCILYFPIWRQKRAPLGYKRLHVWMIYLHFTVKNGHIQGEMAW